MAKISLRVYNREIEGMIEGGQLDEAVAHCQHILKTFSMHVETYRLLGKAYLEGRRYADSADIFQRVLNAVPDDFVSHVGMSIIRDDEGKLDDAIWHMERAFQMQPSNVAIQAELRRLYGRRDGVEPPKIRLSRDALANMYLQGELYNQAIAEIRAILADDPNRPDLQVMLARAYLRAGHKVEAVEVAAQLLKKYSYCLDALRVLVEILPGTSRAEDMQVYRHRLRMLDPYAAFVSGSVFESDKVADAAVSLERLEYKPGQAPLAGPSSQPAWAASLGIKLDEEKREAAPLAWLQEETSEPSASLPQPEQPSAEPVEEIPDFLREAGWKPLDVSASVERFTEPEESEVVEEKEIAKGEMPDWLQAMAPADLSAEEQEEPAEESGDFNQIFANLEAIKGADDFFEEPASAEMGKISPQPEEQAEGLPDWLKDVGKSEQPAAPQAEETPSLDFAPEEAAEPAVSSEPSAEMGEIRPLDIGDDTMAWLESLAARQGARPDELLTKPEERSEALPDWLKETMEEKTPPPEPAAEPLSVETALPPEPVPAPAQPPADLEPAAAPPAEPPAPAAGAAKPLEIGDDTFAWLESLAAKQGARPDELLTKPEERSEEMPDWLQQEAQAGEAAAVVPPSETAPEEIPAPEFEAPRMEPVETPPEETLEEKPLTFADESLAFMAESAAPAATLGEDDIAAWLKKLDETPSGETPAAPAVEETPPVAAEEFPSWLKDLESGETAPAPEPSGLHLPDWMREPTAAAESAPPPSAEELPFTEAEEEPVISPAPVAPSEWVPAEEGRKTESVPERPSTVENVSAGLNSFAEPRLPKPTGALAPLPLQDKDAAFLSNAQRALEAANLGVAMKEYSKLIKKGRLLDEVIHDLREALYRFPVDVIIWQTLGDAYMRAGRLQDALDAYTKAEELLR